MVAQEEIERFLLGEDEEKYIVSIEYDYKTSKIFKVIQDPVKGKLLRMDTFIPFAWVGDLRGKNFYKNNKDAQKRAMSENGIIIEKLQDHGDERLKTGLTFIVKTTKTYSNLINFFKGGGLDPWGRDNSDCITVLSPVEQYLIQKNKRLFKGFEEYDEIHRFVFDIETTGLDPKSSSIFLIGMKDNRGFLKLLSAQNPDEERKMIVEFFKTIDELKPSLIGGYNSAFFDFPFILKRAEILNLNIKKITKTLNPDYTLKQKEGILKLANEMEPYTQTQMWGYNIIDIAHAVRRAQAINSDIKSWSLKYITKFIEAEKQNRVYVEGDKIGKIYFDNEDYWMNKENGAYKKVGLDENIDEVCGRRTDVYDKTTGSKIIEQYLDDDLYETMIVDEQFNQANFLLSKLVPTTYERLSTMGTATLWKMIMCAWSYKNNLALPKKKEKRKFTGGLSRLVQVGYSRNVLKLDYSSLYPSIQLVHDVFPACDVTGAMKSMLKYFRDTRIKYKNLAGEYKSIDLKASISYDRKQLPIKIFINAFFGSLSAPHVFPWGDIDMGEQITCTGRQYLRQMIMYFMKRGYVPLVMDTDGVNFETPEDRENYKYIGKGLNGLVKEGKEYVGAEADVAEYNDLFMRNEMGLDIDGVWPATINVARKNYALLTDKGKVKLTGNSIKSKKLQTYVAEFLDKGLRMLLDGKGGEFLDFYYEYVSKIYNKKIPLAKIANKSRVKQSIDDYKVHITKTTKAGSLMSRQAHMELLMNAGKKPGLGDTIYYVNNGEKKSHGDVQKKTTKMTKKQIEDYMNIHGEVPPEMLSKSEVILNCYLIDEKEIENNPDLLGEYNVPRYLAAFNKRIEPLLVVYSPDIRKDILIEDPKDQPIFTKSQTVLGRGFPMKEKDQDNLDEVLTLSDMEIKFWQSVGIDPYYMYIDDTINLVDESRVKNNKELMEKEIKVSKVDEDEFFEFDTEADLTSLIFD
jgi:DNA polymerase elongation subunit (family B)